MSTERDEDRAARVALLETATRIDAGLMDAAPHMSKSERVAIIRKQLRKTDLLLAVPFPAARMRVAEPHVTEAASEAVAGLRLTRKE